MKEDSQILIYGYGNPGRTDDGLGNEFINRIEKWIKENELKGIEVDSNYQLNIEDADIISKNNYVIFVDASEEDIDDYIFTKVEPSNASVEFTMHAVSSAFVSGLGSLGTCTDDLKHTCFISKVMNGNLRRN